MEKFGDVIRRLREEHELPLRKVAAALDIDQAILSKMERGQRTPTREQVIALAKFFGVKEDVLMVPYLSEQIYQVVGEDKHGAAALKVAEQHLKYNKKK